jgi:hypothetical protein
MRPYTTNIWRPISRNSNEDLDENWITNVLRVYEKLHSICRRWYGKSHARMNRHWRIIICCRGRAEPVIITVLKTRALGAILIIFLDFYFIIFFFFWVTQSFVGFRWTELNSIMRPGMSKFDTRLTTKRSVRGKRVCDTRKQFSRRQRIAYNSLVHNLIVFFFFM